MSSTASVSPSAELKSATPMNGPMAEHLRLLGAPGVSAMLADIVKRAQQRSTKAQAPGTR